MFDDTVLLAVANTYEKKFYLNDEFMELPQQIKEEIQILCVKHVEEVGGVISLFFDEEGNLNIQAYADEEDIMYDDIGSHLKVKEMQRLHKELFESLEMFFKVFYLGEE